MKFKVKYESAEFLFMTIILILCFFTCFIWLSLKEYPYFIIYFLLTLMIFHMYYFTSYQLTDKDLIIKLGFLKIKLKYFKIKKVKKEMTKRKIVYNKIPLNIYPDNLDKFLTMLNTKLTNKNSDIIMK